MKIVQILVGGFDNNFSYLIIGEKNQAFLIDATGNIEIIESVIKENNVKVIAQLLTHSHPDHCELVEYFKQKGVPLVEFLVTKKEPFSFEEKEIAGIKVRAIFTPGHLHDALCFIIEDNIITGDTIFVRGIGTTAYGGNDKELENTLAFLSKLNGKLKVFPGHNYGGESCSLSEALSNSHIRPSPRVLEIIKKKVKEYEEKFGTKY